MSLLDAFLLTAKYFLVIGGLFGLSWIIATMIHGAKTFWAGVLMLIVFLQVLYGN